MNFVTSSSVLLSHLQRISGVLSTNTKMPILDNFLFSIQGNTLTVSATDLETTMITHLEVQSEKDGKIAIPAKLILEILKSLPDQPCTFRINEENFASMNVYPNPASDAINVSFEAANADYSVDVMDIQGRVIASQVVSNVNGAQVVTFATENMAKGNYIVRIASNGFTSTKSVVVR